MAFVRDEARVKSKPSRQADGLPVLVHDDGEKEGIKSAGLWNSGLAEPIPVPYPMKVR